MTFVYFLKVAFVTLFCLMVRYEHSAAIHPHAEELSRCLDLYKSGGDEDDLDPGITIADTGRGQGCDVAKLTHEDAEVKAGSEALESQYPCKEVANLEILYHRKEKKIPNQKSGYPINLGISRFGEN